MAGLAALMTRKKRDRRRELEMKLKLDDTAIAELSGKDAEEALKAKQAHETIKKMLIGKELLHQKSKSQSFDAMSQISYNDNDDDNVKGGFSNAYSPIYIGLILMCIGSVVTFVGLGEKGFKTLELKLIGPVLMLVGFTCITLKIIQCTFPQLFQLPYFLRKRKSISEREKSSLVEKGEGDGDGDETTIVTTTRGRRFQNKETPSPRVMLHSSKKSSTRPRSTIPNYIENTSDSDSDDFDRVGKGHSIGQENTKTPLQKITQSPSKSVAPPTTSKGNRESEKDKTITDTQKISPPPPQPIDSQHNLNSAELVLNPKGLLL